MYSSTECMARFCMTFCVKRIVYVRVSECLFGGANQAKIYIYICTYHAHSTGKNDGVTVGTAHFLNDSRRQSAQIKSTKHLSPVN